MALSIDQLLEYCQLVLNLIHNEDWPKLSQVVSQQKLFRVISEHIQLCDDFNGMTLLHAVVKNNPPSYILDAMLQAHVEALEGQDCLGRTPLHVAAGSGADARIIRKLVRAYPKACDVQDEDGRLPLHIACDTECALFEGDPTPRDAPTMDVIKALLAGSTKSTLVEDEDEMNPIEYAIVSDLDIKIVKLLQKASMVVRKKEKDGTSGGGGKGDSSSDKAKEEKPIAPLPRNILAYC